MPAPRLNNRFHQHCRHEIDRRIQNKILKPINNNIWLHRRALSTLAQIYCSKKHNLDDTTLYNIQNTDIQELFLCANDILEISEENLLPEINHPSERILFVSFKWIGDLITATDIQASTYFFEKYYNEILKSDSSLLYSDKFIKETGLKFSDYMDLLNNFAQIKISKNNFEQMGKLLAVNFRELSNKWDSRFPKLQIPFEYRFLETFPMVNWNGNLYVLALHLLFTGLLRKAYHCLSGTNEGKNFRDLFGGKIVEPTIKAYLRELLIDDTIKELNVSKDDYQYADFGVIHKNLILLFEIKSSLMGLSMRYESSPEKFFQEFDKRYASRKSGAGQQVERLLDINRDFESFCKLTELKPNKKYSMYNILLVFDDTLSAEGSNLYVRNKYQYFISRADKKIDKFYTPPRNSTLTFNELYMLNKELRTPKERFQFLLDYNSSDHCFNFFMGQKGMLK